MQSKNTAEETRLAMIYLSKNCRKNKHATYEFTTWFIRKYQWETLC